MFTKNKDYLRTPSVFSTKAQAKKFYKNSESVDQIMFGLPVDSPDDELCADEENQKKYLNQKEIYTFNQLLWVIAYCIDLDEEEHRKLLYRWLQDYYQFFENNQIFSNFLKQVLQPANSQTTKQIHTGLGLEQKSEAKTLENELITENQELAKNKAINKLAKLFNKYAFEFAERCPQLIDSLSEDQLEALSDPNTMQGKGFTNRQSFCRRLDLQGLEVLKRTPTSRLVFQTVLHWQTKPDWKTNASSKLNQLKKCDTNFRKLNQAMYGNYLPNFIKLNDEDKNKVIGVFEDPCLMKALHFPKPEDFSKLRKLLNSKEEKDSKYQANPASTRILKSCAQAFVKNKIDETNLSWGEWFDIVFSKKIFNWTQEVQKVKKEKCITELAGCNIDFDKVNIEQKHWQEQSIVEEIVEHWDDIKAEQYRYHRVIDDPINVNILLTKLLKSSDQKQVLESCHAMFGDINQELWQKFTVKGVFDLAAKTVNQHLKAHLANQLAYKLNEKDCYQLWNNVELKELLYLATCNGAKRSSHVFAFQRRILEEKEPVFFEKVLDCFKNLNKNTEAQLVEFILNIFVVKKEVQLNEEQRRLFNNIRLKVIQYKPSDELKEVHEGLKLIVSARYLEMSGSNNQNKEYYYHQANQYNPACSLSNSTITRFVGRTYTQDMVQASPSEEISSPQVLIIPDGIFPATVSHRSTTPSQETPVITDAKLVTPVTAIKSSVQVRTPQTVFHTGHTPSSPNPVLATSDTPSILKPARTPVSHSSARTTPSSHATVTFRSPLTPLRSNLVR